MLNVKLSKPPIQTTNSKFDPNEVLSTDVELPPSVNYRKISIMDDNILNLPYIAQV